MDEDGQGGPIDLAREDIDSIRGRDIGGAMAARETAPKPTWFVKRQEDGFIFPVEELEAWEIAYNNSTWKRRDFRFIGHSDGTTFAKIVKQSMAAAKVLEPEMAALRKEIDKYRAMEDRIMRDEIIDMDGDPTDEENEAGKKRILKIRVITEKHEVKYAELEKQYRLATKDVVKTAEAAELKVAIANWKKQPVWPNEDLNVITPKTSGNARSRVLKAMNRA